MERGCTFDYFADAENFIKRFGHLLVEAGIRKNPESLGLSVCVVWSIGCLFVLVGSKCVVSIVSMFFGVILERF